MKKQDYLLFVTQALIEHPEWLADTFSAANHAVMARISQEQEKRAEAEVAVSMLSVKFDKLPENYKEVVARVLVNSKMFGGTEYANDLQEQYLSKK